MLGISDLIFPIETAGEETTVDDDNDLSDVGHPLLELNVSAYHKIEAVSEIL